MFLMPFTAAVIIRTIYELLKKSGRIDPKNKIIFALIFADMCILWIFWFVAAPMNPKHFGLSPAFRYLGLGAVILGTVLAVGSLIQLRGLENITHLVTRGLFARLRHPMYTGFILWILGWSLYYDAAVSFFTGLFGIANILYWRHLEERHLERTFGGPYRQYKKQTWF